MPGEDLQVAAIETQSRKLPMRAELQCHVPCPIQSSNQP
jgi:hypothetical protein